MPTYEYKCECGNMVSLIQQMDDIHESVCTRCKKLMRRIYSALPFMFRGHPAWYDPKRMDADYDKQAYYKMKEMGK